jgi:hypothetical protein
LKSGGKQSLEFENNCRMKADTCLVLFIPVSVAKILVETIQFNTSNSVLANSM